MSDNATMTITEFLEARIAEDEAAAKLREEGDEFFDDEITVRMFAECAAKRAILGRYVHSPTPNTYDLALLDVMRDIAAVYAEHPDYDERWAV